jgi:urea transporter
MPRLGVKFVLETWFVVAIEGDLAGRRVLHGSGRTEQPQEFDPEAAAERAGGETQQPRDIVGRDTGPGE